MEFLGRRRIHRATNDGFPNGRHGTFIAGGMGLKKFIVISYDLVSKKQDELSQKNFQFVIVDESHCIKDSKSARTKAVEPLLKASKYLVLLSGTPALSRPIELFTQICALDPKLFRWVSEFGNRYCDGKMKKIRDREIPDYSGSSHMTELSLLLKERCYCCRRYVTGVGEMLLLQERCNCCRRDVTAAGGM